jgi:2,4-dienoyl-CoA reductase-like NADH-dependent reductase (Old Yellow Enzyme family)
MSNTRIGLQRSTLILQPAALAQLELRNRIVVAPMTRVSARRDGVPTAHMAQYYSNFARGEFGLIISEGIFAEARYGRAYARQPVSSPQNRSTDGAG